VALLSLIVGAAPRAASASISFGTPVNYTIVGTPGGLAALDLDGDGKLDLVAIAGDHTSLFYGHGDGTFDATPVDIPIAGAAAVADVDGDGKPDLILARDFYGSVAVLRNLGGRTYAAPVEYPVNGSRPILITVTDFTGDGKPDIAASVYDSGYVGIFPNNGDGTFGDPTYYWTEGGPGRLIAHDFNNDGKLDWAVRSASSNSITLYQGDGAGNYTFSGLMPTGTGAGFMLGGDFTGDGQFDLISAEYWDNGITLYPGNSDGTFFVPSGGIPINQYPLGVGAADFDGDGNLDVVAGNAGTGYFSVLRNQGGGVFDAPMTFNSGDSNPRALAVGDFDGDGKPDVALANDTSFGDHVNSSISVLLNKSGQNLISVTVSPGSVIGGDAVTGTVTLAGPAPAGGAVVSLSDDLAATTLPATVTVPAGQTSAPFSIATSFVSATQSGTVSASYGSDTRTAGLTVRPVAVALLELIPDPVKGGKQVNGQVTLDHAAGPGGLIVSLSSSDASVAAPTSATVKIAAGASTATFKVKTSPLKVTKTAIITASANGTSQARVLTVTP
jgi:hypothetical protein